MSGFSGDEFLRFGALVGTVGWLGTQLAAWGRVGPLPVLVLWVGLLGVMARVGLRRTDDAVQFSRPLVVWAVTNATAMGWTIAAVLGVPVPAADLAGWLPWLGSFTVAYAVTGWLVPANRRTYLLGSVGAVVVGVSLLAAPAMQVVSYLLVGIVHVAPLVDATR
ncbi:hypothetical protein [Haloarchaeobius sp. DT45]|uniref:hypothetical protein n=1 Tax=Haloarchaeobius sp. DT45 TaxID=3446116 RepID=UPI003F6BFE9D